MLMRFGQADPKPGQWEGSWRALQAQLREALAMLAERAGGAPPD